MTIDEFRPPAFYAPFPATTNPHLDSARPRLVEWARTVGLVGNTGPGVWSEDDFTATDFTLFVAMTHPYSSADELSILACWYAVTWYLDDLVVPARGVLVDRDGRDGAGRRVDADRGVHIGPLACPIPPRLPGLSRRAGLGGGQPRPPPLRRSDPPVGDAQGAALTGALLAEHALGLDIPEPICTSRAFRMVTDAFRDTVALHNDIVSYPKELRQGEAPNNVITVVQQLFGLPLGAAVDHVNQVLTGRVRTLEEAPRTEIPLVLDDLGAGDDTRRAVYRYVQALQQWVAGSYHWHGATARYAQHGAVAAQV